MRRVPVAPLVKFLAFAVVVALATTVLGLTIANAQGGARTGYSATFTDAAGLLPGDDVRIAGVVVGSVDKVAIVDRRLAEVDFSVDAAQPVPASATAAILYKNLIGQRFLALGQGAGATGATLKAGDTIPVAHTRPPLNLTTLFNGFQPLFAALDPQQVNTLSMEIVQVLQGEGGTVEHLLASTASLTNEIANRDQVIGQLITNLNTVMATIGSRDQELSNLIATLQQLVSGLAADSPQIGEAIASIGELTNVTAGFIAEARPALKDDIAALGHLASNLNDSEAVINSVLQNAPYKLNTLGRASSYGSWFNFFLCQAQGTIGVDLPPPLPPVDDLLVVYPNPAFLEQQRCLGPNPLPAPADDGQHHQQQKATAGLPPR
jgi:phospholipid/cholesterol/gamma-HCH transport system substrate-binding protein